MRVRVCVHIDQRTIFHSRFSLYIKCVLNSGIELRSLSLVADPLPAKLSYRVPPHLLFQGISLGRRGLFKFKLLHMSSLSYLSLLPGGAVNSSEYSVEASDWPSGHAPVLGHLDPQGIAGKIFAPRRQWT